MATRGTPRNTATRRRPALLLPSPGWSRASWKARAAASWRATGARRSLVFGSPRDGGGTPLPLGVASLSACDARARFRYSGRQVSMRRGCAGGQWLSRRRLNLAARLSSSRPPGEVLVSESLAHVRARSTIRRASTAVGSASKAYPAGSRLQVSFLLDMPATSRRHAESVRRSSSRRPLSQAITILAS